MRLQIFFLKPTNPKILKICKKGSSLGAIQPSKISPFEVKSVQVFSKSAQLFIHRVKFQKTISRFPGQDCSFRNQKKFSHANSNQNLSHIHYRFEAQCQSNASSSFCSM